MRVPRSFRSLATIAILGLAGVTLGCSGDESGSSVDPAAKAAENKKIAEQMKNDQLARKAAMQQNAGQRKGGRGRP